jgi:hypothetical protein
MIQVHAVNRYEPETPSIPELAHVFVGEQRFALASRMPPSDQAPKNLLGHASPGHAPATLPLERLWTTPGRKVA